MRVEPTLPDRQPLFDPGRNRSHRLGRRQPAVTHTATLLRDDRAGALGYGPRASNGARLDHAIARRLPS